MGSVDDLKELGRHVLRKTHTFPLRREMEAFLEKHPARDLKGLRQKAVGGKPLSDIVTEEREERL